MHAGTVPAWKEEAWQEALQDLTLDGPSVRLPRGRAGSAGRDLISWPATLEELGQTSDSSSGSGSSSGDSVFLSDAGDVDFAAFSRPVDGTPYEGPRVPGYWDLTGRWPAAPRPTVSSGSDAALEIRAGAGAGARDRPRPAGDAVIKWPESIDAGEQPRSSEQQGKRDEGADPPSERGDSESTGMDACGTVETERSASSSGDNISALEVSEEPPARTQLVRKIIVSL